MRIPVSFLGLAALISFAPLRAQQAQQQPATPPAPENPAPAAASPSVPTTPATAAPAAKPAPVPSIAPAPQSAAKRPEAPAPKTPAAAQPEPKNDADAPAMPDEPEESRPATGAVSPLIPESMPAVEEAVGAETIDKAREKVAEVQTAFEELRDRVKFREARNRAVEEPELQDMWTAVKTSRTDEEMRLARIEYYNALFDRMKKIDPSIKTRIDAHRTETIQRLSFRRIRGHGEEPPPRDAAPAAGPEEKEKKKPADKPGRDVKP